MTKNNAQALIDDLDSLLDRERMALIDGDLELLGRMLAQKQELIDNLNNMDTLEREHLADVHDKVTRNQELLNSAMEGIRAVANRMADLRRVRQGLETYDQSGHKTRFDTHTQPSVEKRA
ncbi:MAG TPA: flagellar biosynthesis protein FlgN [Rhodobacteraceae bacterium]|nr:flagellar biosynthesis protein FlgN [Paracoccaceae bacterium]